MPCTFFDIPRDSPACKSSQREMGHSTPVIAMLLCPLLLPAQEGVKPLTTPPARAHHALAYDASLGEVVLYGGSTPLGGNKYDFFDDLWSWNGRRWLRIAETGTPRSSHSMVYEAAGKRLVTISGMFGQQRYSETRTFDGKRWVELSSVSEMNLADTAAAYDSRRKRIVLFGGLRPDRTLSGVTWEWDGKEWRKAAEAGPGGLSATAMVYDEARGVTLLFGGGDAAGKRHGETWQWNGTEWTQLPVTGPPARLAAGFTFDAKRKLAILFGGLGDAVLGDTWSFDGKTWKQITGVAPSARIMPQLAFDRRRGVVVLFGGRYEFPGDSDETWEWNGKQWKQAGGLAR